MLAIIKLHATLWWRIALTTAVEVQPFLPVSEPLMGRVVEGELRAWRVLYAPRASLS